MCGRFALAEIPKPLADLFGLPVPTIKPRRTIAPTQPVTVLLRDPERAGPEFQDIIWGLVPFWSKDKKMMAKCFNARSETAHEKPAFRAAFRHRRCLVPVSGFYEWKTEGKTKTPYYFTAANPGEPMVLAGLWEDWTDGHEYLRTATILTMAANGIMLPVHDRMPVVLPPECWNAWLDTRIQNRNELERLLSVGNTVSFSLHTAQF